MDLRGRDHILHSDYDWAVVLLRNISPEGAGEERRREASCRVMPTLDLIGLRAIASGINAWFYATSGASSSTWQKQKSTRALIRRLARALRPFDRICVVVGSGAR